MRASSKIGVSMVENMTPTLSRLLDVLRDGKEHPAQELLTCLSDELADVTLLKVYITKLRRIVAPKGLYIQHVGFRSDKPAYIMTRRLASYDD